jgi:hypothetical protein
MDFSDDVLRLDATDIIRYDDGDRFLVDDHEHAHEGTTKAAPPAGSNEGHDETRGAADQLRP